MPVLKPVFGIFAVLGWLALIGLHIIWHYTFGWLFTTLADLLDSVEINAKFIHVRPLGTPAAWLRSLDRNVDASLVKAANKLEHVAVWLFSRVAHFFGAVADELAGLAVTVEHKFLRLLKVTVPRLIRHALAFVWRELRALGRYARKMIPKLARQLLRFTRWAVHEIAKGARHLGFLWKWAKAVLKYHWKVIHGLLKRVYKIEHALLPKGFRKLLVTALAPMGGLWIFNDTVLRAVLWVMARPGEVWEFVKDEVQVTLKENICVLNAFAYDIAVYVLEPVIRQEVALLHWICQPEGDTLPYGCVYPTVYKGAWEPYGTPKVREPFEETRLAPGVPLPGGVIQA